LFIRDEQISNLEASIDGCKTSLSELTFELESVRIDYSECNSQLTVASSRLSDKEALILSLHDKKELLEKELFSRDERISSLQTDLEENKQAALGRMSELESLRCDCTEYARKISEMTSILSNSDGMVLKTREEKVLLESQLEDGERHLSKLQDLIEKERKESSELATEMESLRSACADYQSKLTAEELISADCKEQIASLLEVKKDLEDQLQNSREAILELQSSSEGMNAVMCNLSSEVENLRRNYAGESSKVANLEEKVVLLRTEKEGIEEKLQSCENIISTFQQTVAEKEAEVDGIVSELTLEIEMLRSDCSEYCEKLEEVSSQLVFREEALGSSRREKDDLGSQIAYHIQTISQLEACVEENQALVGELSSKLESLQDDYKKLTDESSRKVNEIERQLESTEAEKNVVSNQLQHFQETVSSLQSMIEEKEGALQNLSSEFNKKLVGETFRADGYEAAADKLKKTVSSLESRLKTFVDDEQRRSQHTQRQRPVMVTTASQTTPVEVEDQHEEVRCDLGLIDREISQQKEYQRNQRATDEGGDESQHSLKDKTRHDQNEIASALEQQLSEQDNLVEHLNFELNEKMDELEECYLRLDELIRCKEEQQKNSDKRIVELRESLDEVLSANKELEERLSEIILPIQQNGCKGGGIVAKDDDLSSSPNLLSEVLNLSNCLLELQNAEYENDGNHTDINVMDGDDGLVDGGDGCGYTLGCKSGNRDRNLEKLRAAEDKVRGALAQIFDKLQQFSDKSNGNNDDVEGSSSSLPFSPQKYDTGVQCSQVDSPESKFAGECEDNLMSPASTAGASRGSFLGEISQIVSQGEAEIQSVLNIFEREIAMEPWKRRRLDFEADIDDSSSSSYVSFDESIGCHQCKKLRHEYQQILDETLRLIEGSRSVNEAAIQAAKVEVRRQAAEDLEKRRLLISDQLAHVDKKKVARYAGDNNKTVVRNAAPFRFVHRRVRSAEL